MTTVNPNVAEARPRRPAWVWVISTFYLLSAGWTILSFGMILSGAVPMSPAQRQYFSSLTTFDYVLALGIAVLNLTGTVLLFLLRRQAFQVFLSAFIIGLLTTIYQVIAKNWLSAIGGPGLIGACIGWLISISIIMYVRALSRRGVLR